MVCKMYHRQKRALSDFAETDFSLTLRTAFHNNGGHCFLGSRLSSALRSLLQQEILCCCPDGRESEVHILIPREL